MLARACVTQGVEATVESWVSVMENHCSKVRGITDQVRLENEVKVAINGPEVQHCKGIVREAMRVGEGTLLEGVVILSLILCPRL